MTEQPIKNCLCGKNGRLKSKEDFLKDMEKLYSEFGGKENGPCYMDLFISPEISFSPDDVLDRQQFIERKLYIDEIDGKLAQYVLEHI